MTEYWKSNPRKFCDFCKCWTADNKPSIDFHERGKRHKENVQKRLAEMGRKGQEDFNTKQRESDYFAEMEQAALSAYKKDIEQNPDIMGNRISDLAAASNATIVVASNSIKESGNEDATVLSNSKKWYEAKTPEGISYYWHMDSGESVWQPPDQGFISLVEQAKQNKKETSVGKNNSEKKVVNTDGEKKVKSKDSEKKIRNKRAKVVVGTAIGPTLRVAPYSSWQAIQQLPRLPVDLQLPQLESEDSPVEIYPSKPSISFTEKQVTLSASSKEDFSSSFKKRKVTQDHKSIIRERNNDL